MPTPCQQRFATVVPMLGRWTKLRRANVTWQRRANGSTEVVPTLDQRQLASWLGGAGQFFKKCLSNSQYI